MENIDYEEIKKDYKDSFYNLLKKENIKNFEHEDVVDLLLEACSYRDYLTRIEISQAINNLFLDTAQGKDLDRLVYNFYGIKAIEEEKDIEEEESNFKNDKKYKVRIGKKPEAKVLVKKDANRLSKLVIEKDHIFYFSSNMKATLKKQLVFDTTEIEKEAILVLEKYVKESEQEIINTNISEIEITSTDRKSKIQFTGGKETETDDELRKRALKNLKPSTAGNVSAYTLWLKEIRPDIIDIKVKTNLDRDKIIYFHNYKDGNNIAQYNYIKNLIENDKKYKLKNVNIDKEAISRSPAFAGNLQDGKEEIKEEIKVTFDAPYQVKIVFYIPNFNKQNLDKAQLDKFNTRTPLSIKTHLIPAKINKNNCNVEIKLSKLCEKYITTKLKKDWGDKKEEFIKSLKLDIKTKLKVYEKIERDLTKFEIKYVIAYSFYKLMNTEIQDILFTDITFNSDDKIKAREDEVIVLNISKLDYSFEN